ncbi:hypothetical protein QYM36_006636 [Artemia franciscana]|uniref:Synembryn-A n=2 Tax=Artemia franciscana TaxID=6661 RepID=A0AA88HX33_ARTSF|nr:hypothetical protein QYM36_006636 [Artemia franciscana]
MIDYLNRPKLSLEDSHPLLDSVKVLSRDKPWLRGVIFHDLLKSIGKYAKLFGEGCLDPNQISENQETILKAQKAIFNLVLNSSDAREVLATLNYPQLIVKRLNEDIPYEIMAFDLKILFLSTALYPQLRNILKDEANALEVLTKLLKKLAHIPPIEKEPTERLTEVEADLMSETLKLLFNITFWIDSSLKDPELCRLVSTLKVILLQTCQKKTKEYEIKSHVVNLLTNIPTINMYQLYIMEDSEEEIKYDMRGIDVTLDLLNQKLDSGPARSVEELAPILTFFCIICKALSAVRKHVRSIVLPPMKSEITERPEVGNSLRNKLVKRMTAASRTQVSQLSAQLLFVLCKENVGRFIKYTGYGNAAGLLAENGLMLGRPGNGELYSDDSDDSETEEFKELEDKVNPITGCVEKPHPNPMEGMSEEQKEYEAMNLVNLIDRLQRSGIVKPCHVGEDGRPHPVDHILQLKDQLERPLGRNQDTDED